MLQIQNDQFDHTGIVCCTIKGETTRWKGSYRFEHTGHGSGGVMPDLDHIITVNEQHYLVHPSDKKELGELLEKVNMRQSAAYAFRLMDLGGRSIIISGTVHGITIEKPGQANAYHAWSEKISDKYRILLNNIEQAFCIIEMIFDKNGQAIDYRFLETNPAFEKQTVFRNAAGKTMRELQPDQEQHWFDLYGKVALTGEPVHFVQHARHIGDYWYDVYALPAGPVGNNCVALFFSNITERIQTEQQLREAKERLASVLEAGLAGTFYWNVQKDLVTTDENMRHYFSLSEKALDTGVPLAEVLPVIHKEDRDKVTKALTMAVENTGIYNIEYRVRHMDGKIRWLSARGHVERNSQGKAIALPGFAVDITLMKQAEAVLRKSEEEYRAQLEAEVNKRTAELKESNDLLEAIAQSQVVSLNAFKAIRDKQDKIIDLEWTFANAVTQSFAEGVKLVGKRYTDIFSGEEGENIFDMYCQVIETGQPLDYEFNYKNEGQDGWFRSIVVKLGDGVLITAEDITPRKKAEQDLKKNKDLLQSVFDTVQSSISVYNIAYDSNHKAEDFEILMFNDYTYQLTFTNPSVIGKKYSEVFPTVKKNGILDKFRKVADTGISQHFEQLYVGEKMNNWFNIHASKLDDLLVVITEDTTVRKKAEQQLQELNESLQQKNTELNRMNQELGNFAFVASHDLREPLRKIKTFSNLLMEKSDAEKRQEYVTKIVGAVDRMGDLIDDILMFSRASSQDKPVMKRIDLDKVLETVISDLSELIGEKHAVVVHEKLPHMKGNPLQLAQLFQNLITNGIKFQPKKNTPQVHIRAERLKGEMIDSPLANPTTDYVVIVVSDNGIGFEEQYAEKIFQMFQRLHGQAEYRGTGMGLAICKRVMENHNGFIKAKGYPGKGAVFHCCFPVE